MNICKNCETKLKIINFKCKCGNKYCMSCKLPELHKCEYNYKNNKDELKKKLPKIISKKINF